QMAGSWSQAHLSKWAWFSILLGNHSTKGTHENPLQLLGGRNFNEWFSEHESSLRADRYDRMKNHLVATHILPLLERNPYNWKAIRFLPDSRKPFAEFILLWRERCPSEQRPF